MKTAVALSVFGSDTSSFRSQPQTEPAAIASFLCRRLFPPSLRYAQDFGEFLKTLNRHCQHPVVVEFKVVKRVHPHYDFVLHEGGALGAAVLSKFGGVLARDDWEEEIDVLRKQAESQVVTTVERLEEILRDGSDELQDVEAQVAAYEVGVSFIEWGYYCMPFVVRASLRREPRYVAVDFHGHTTVCIALSPLHRDRPTLVECQYYILWCHSGVLQHVVRQRVAELDPEHKVCCDVSACWRNLCRFVFAYHYTRIAAH